MGFFDDLLAVKGFHLYQPGKNDGSGLFSTDDLIPGFINDLLGPKSDYVLEIWGSHGTSNRASLQRAIILPIHPEAIEIIRPGHTTTSYTMGEQPIREHSKHRNLVIRLKGRSGLTERSAHDRKGNTVLQSGPALIRELDAFLDYYQSRAVTSQNYFANPLNYRNYANSCFLVLRSFSEHIHVKVEVTDWKVTRDVKTSRFSYLWQLDFQAYAAMTPEKPDGLFQVFQDFMTYGTCFVNAGAAVMSLATNAVDNFNNIANSIRAPIQAMQNLAQQFSNMTQRIVATGQIPRLFMNDLANAFATGRNAFDRLWTEKGGGVFSENTLDLSDEVRRLTDILNITEQAATLAVSSAGASGLNADDNTPAANIGANPEKRPPFIGEDPFQPTAPPVDHYAMPGLDPIPPTSDPERPAHVITVHEGETLRDIAQKWMGNARYWMAICEHNKMPSPYTKSDGTPLKTGDALLVPTRSSFIEKAMLSPTQKMSTDRFGKDLYMNPRTGDLEMVGLDGIDIRTVTDKENLEQAIRNRLLTRQNECSYWPAYGLPSFIGEKHTAETLGYLAAHLNAQLLQDPRIIELDTMRLTDEGDGLTAYLEVVPILGSNVSVISAI